MKVVLVALVIVVGIVAVASHGHQVNEDAKSAVRAEAARPRAAEELAASARRRAFAVRAEKSRTGTGRNNVLKFGTGGPDDTTLIVVLEACDEATPLGLLRGLGKSTLTDLGFAALMCGDPAGERHTLRL